MTNILDQSRDVNHQELYRIVKQYEAPDYVKTASFEDLGAKDIEDKSVNAFANRSNKSYPYHTPAATWVSTSFLLEKRANYNRIEFDNMIRRLNEAAEIHGISRDIKSLSEKIASSNRTPNDSDLPDDNFAVVILHDNGAKERHLRLSNDGEVKAAAEFLYKFRDQFTFDQRQSIAEKILDKANTLDTTFEEKHGEFLEKQAAFGGCATEDVGRLLWSRVQAVGKQTKEAKAASFELAKIARTLLKNPKRIHTPGTLTKVASIIDQVDKQFGLTGLYGSVLSRPEDVLFVVTQKTASHVADSHFSTVTGNIYNKNDLNRIKYSEVESLMGPEFADSISAGGLFVDPEKLATELHTLPRGDAKLMDRLLRDNGVAPVVKEAAHSNSGITKEELNKLAAYHKERRTKEANEHTKALGSEFKKDDFKPSRGAAVASLALNLSKKFN